MHQSQAQPPVTVWSVCCLGLIFRFLTSLSCPRPQAAPNDPSPQLGCLHRFRAVSPVCRTPCPLPPPVKLAAFTAQPAQSLPAKPALNLAPLPGVYSSETRAPASCPGLTEGAPGSLCCFMGWFSASLLHSSCLSWVLLLPGRWGTPVCPAVLWARAEGLPQVPVTHSHLSPENWGPQGIPVWSPIVSTPAYG